MSEGLRFHLGVEHGHHDTVVRMQDAGAAVDFPGPGVRFGPFQF